jgi:hypothetical protein
MYVVCTWREEKEAAENDVVGHYQESKIANGKY